MNDKPQFHSAPFSDSPQERGNPLDAVTFNSRGQVEPATDGNDSEAYIERLKVRFGLNNEQAMELVDEMLEVFGGDSRGRTSGTIEDALRINNKEWSIWLGRILLMEDCYSTRQNDPKFIYLRQPASNISYEPICVSPY